MSHDNIITLDHSPREIPLTQGQVAIVCQHNYEWVSQWKWSASKSPNMPGFYSKRSVMKNYVATPILMHRLIAGTPSGLVTDHLNHNTLDNRCLNLEIKTTAGNLRNQKTRHDNTSGRKGVSWSKDKQKWAATIGVGGKHLHLGRFENFDDAVAARLAGEIKYGFVVS